jgi:16S rRNA (uracil1498-N3)-methyltransferase
VIRLLVPSGSLTLGDPIRVDDDEAHHLEVRRVASGTTGEALDGAGVMAAGVLERAGKRWSFVAQHLTHAPAPPATVLAVGGGDKDRFLWLAEKCAELGVTTLVPLETTRSRHVENRLRAGTLEKARRRAREACKQSGNPWAPEITNILTIPEIKGRGAVVWWLADGGGVSAPVVAPDGAIGWLIGPEGGFVTEDLTMLDHELAPVRVTLGVHVLRFETAAIAAAVLTADRRRP